MQLAKRISDKYLWKGLIELEFFLYEYDIEIVLSLISAKKFYRILIRVMRDSLRKNLLQITYKTRISIGKSSLIFEAYLRD